MEKYIAYRTKDLENDVWSEISFLFNTEDDVKKFFTADNQKLFELFTDEDDRGIYDFEINGLNGNINHVSFNTEYAGEVNIYEMNAGYVIHQP